MVNFQLIIKIPNKESYILKRFNDDSIFLQTESGEGMEVSNDKFYKLLDDYFRENF